MNGVVAQIDALIEAARPALHGRRVLLGVSGGIAAYKAAELTRLFVRAGAEVRVVMTHAAKEFITPLTLQSLSTHPVVDALFDLHAEANIGHIEVADWAELFVIAPATAHVIGRLAHGLADDALTTIALATRAPLLVAPAMNVNMWQHAATQANMATLEGRGAATCGPDLGDLACGWVGAGRMAEPLDILAAAAAHLVPRSLAGKRVLVAAGPTREAIDPVRYISNRSTGKMGYAVAAEAAARGAEVVLVSGPTALATPPGVGRVDVVTAEQMRNAVLERVEGVAIVVMAAAVADERPTAPATRKLKKTGAASTLALEPTSDILAELGARKWSGARPTLVGFAAETEQLVAHAQTKLDGKHCDLIVANDVGADGAGFEVDTNRVTLVGRDSAPDALPLLTKQEVARRILDAAEGMHRG
jgi:phosphopantothenoylcysteine decarboxylase/phosphopantothenate--cysteine ligase